MEKFNKLSRAEMKQISGAVMLSAPSKPTAGFGFLTEDESGKGYKCCVNGHSDVCSDCIAEAQSNWYCTSGNTLTAC